MKLWIDPSQPAPEGFIWVKTPEEARAAINHYERNMTDDSITINIRYDFQLKDTLFETSADPAYTFYTHGWEVK